MDVLSSAAVCRATGGQSQRCRLPPLRALPLTSSIRTRRRAIHLAGILYRESSAARRLKTNPQGPALGEVPTDLQVGISNQGAWADGLHHLRRRPVDLSAHYDVSRGVNTPLGRSEPKADPIRQGSTGRPNQLAIWGSIADVNTSRMAFLAVLPKSGDSSRLPSLSLTKEAGERQHSVQQPNLLLPRREQFSWRAVGVVAAGVRQQPIPSNKRKSVSRAPHAGQIKRQARNVQRLVELRALAELQLDPFAIECGWTATPNLRLLCPSYRVHRLAGRYAPHCYHPESNAISRYYGSFSATSIVLARGPLFRYGKSGSLSFITRVTSHPGGDAG